MFALVFLLIAQPLMNICAKTWFFIPSLVVFALGLVLLLLAVVFTIISAINYMVKNPTVLKEQPKPVQTECSDMDVACVHSSASEAENK